MAMVKLNGRYETSATDDSFICVNTDNLTFVTPGPVETSGDATYQQLFFHFYGGIESIGFWVPEADQALEKLGG